MPDLTKTCFTSSGVNRFIFSLKLYNEGEDDPGNLTKIKQRLEDNQTFLKVANEMELWRYIFAANKQKIEGTSILAEVFEAICGAIYLDSNYDLKIVEQKIIDIYFSDWDLMIEQSPHLNKNQLLEYLQNIYKITPKLAGRHLVVIFKRLAWFACKQVLFVV